MAASRGVTALIAHGSIGSPSHAFSQVKGHKAFVVFTMPSELGDWDNKEHIVVQARAKRRLAECLNRKFSRRFSDTWTREHNTKNESDGRLQLNVLWDEKSFPRRSLNWELRAKGKAASRLLTFIRRSQ
jgi:hypothetical protein